jgi:hypothetical protein
MPIDPIDLLAADRGLAGIAAIKAGRPLVILGLT